MYNEQLREEPYEEGYEEGMEEGGEGGEEHHEDTHDVSIYALCCHFQLFGWANQLLYACTLLILVAPFLPMPH